MTNNTNPAAETARRTSITHDGHRVTVTTWDADAGRMISTAYMAPLSGGYVRIDDGRSYPQVCEGLANTGDALTLRAGGDLLALIRREWRRARAADRRDWSR